MTHEKRQNKRNISEISISFLDVISCGFGAIVLLLLIAKTVDSSFSQTEKDPTLLSIPIIQKKLFEIRGEINVLKEALRYKEDRLQNARKKVASLEQEIIENQQKNSVFADEQAKLELAQQSLSDEMRRLVRIQKKSKKDSIGGIPVDSEYIVFIIDTSGSMSNFAWTKVKREMINILNIYPQVKGIQVMNDMGDYMFSSFNKKWIPDTPARRKAILNRLATWAPFSNSSPVEGIQKAIRQFYTSKNKISLYVFGDDFTGGSIGQVLKATDKINKIQGTDRLVRIHTVGFPVHFKVEGGNLQTATRFSALMRELSYDNNGTFIGLTGLE